ncbi:DUF3822 family protein [Bacteroidota bacterium]
MRSYTVIDDSLDRNLCSKYHLSIQTSLDGFSFCILDTSSKKYLALKHFSFDPSIQETMFAKIIHKVIASEELLHKPYKRVYMSVVTNKSILIPSSLFDKNKLSGYFEFSQVLNSTDVLLYNKMNNAGAFNIFAIPEGIDSILDDYFPVRNIYHHSVSLIENALDSSRAGHNEKRVYVEIHRSFFNIVVTNGDSLLLYNTFSYKDSSDMLYYILNIYKQLDLSVENNALIISGEIAVNSNHYFLIKKYFRQVMLEEFSSKFFYSNTFNKIPDQHFTNLINLFNCVS